MLRPGRHFSRAPGVPRGTALAHDSNQEIWPAAVEAAQLVEDGMILGLGTGRAASMFVRQIALRAEEGLSIRGVATSTKTEELARSLAIPLVTLEEIERIDLDVDGADEVSPNLDLIKGHGGALVREKVVAACSKRLVILVGEEKLVPQLGARVALPVEVVPFGMPLVRRELEKLGRRVSLRLDGDSPFRTDNGNVILDVTVEGISLPAELERTIDAIPGVVDSGLFVGMTDLVLVQTDSGVRRLERS